MKEWIEEDEKKHRERQKMLKEYFKKERKNGSTLEEELDLKCIRLDSEMGWD